jgi:hypothetical protein
MRVVRPNPRITKTSNSMKEGVVGVFIEKKGIWRNMRRCGRGRRLIMNTTFWNI